MSVNGYEPIQTAGMNRGELVPAVVAIWPGHVGNTRVSQVSASFRMSSQNRSGLAPAVLGIRRVLADIVNTQSCQANAVGQPPVCALAAPEPRDTPAKPADQGLAILLLESGATILIAKIRHRNNRYNRNLLQKRVLPRSPDKDRDHPEMQDLEAEAQTVDHGIFSLE